MVAQSCCFGPAVSQYIWQEHMVEEPIRSKEAKREIQRVLGSNIPFKGMT
jgi:hypothetical protein